MQLQYSKEKLQEAREYAAESNYKLAHHAHDKDFGFASHITEQDKDDYVEKQTKYAEEIEAGKHDDNFTVWQRMNYYLTGENIPFLPKAL